MRCAGCNKASVDARKSTCRCRRSAATYKRRCIQTIYDVCIKASVETIEPTCCCRTSAATYAGTVSATDRALRVLGPSGVSYARLKVPSPCFWMPISFHCTLHGVRRELHHTSLPRLQRKREQIPAVKRPYCCKRPQQVTEYLLCTVTVETNVADLMRSACLAAMAQGRDWRPLRKEPTVWPAGLGGRRASRGGGGLARLAWICLMTPATMLPPAFSSAYTCPAGRGQRLQIYRQRHETSICRLQGVWRCVFASVHLTWQAQAS